MAAIREVDVENFIKHHKRRGVKNSTIGHYIVDLRALFFWAMKKQHRFVRINPVTEADLGLIQNRKVIKPPLKLQNFDRSFTMLDAYERSSQRTHEPLR